MKVYLLILLLINLSVLACTSKPEQYSENNRQSKKASPANTSSPETKKQDTIQAEPKLTNQYSINDIQGVWGSLDTLENAYYVINGDSIFYLEGGSYPVEVANDSLNIHYDYGTISSKINWIRSDTMSYTYNGAEELILRGER